MELVTYMEIEQDTKITYELNADRTLILSVGRSAHGLGVSEGLSLLLGEAAMTQLIDKLNEGLAEVRSGSKA
ncbi:hypothetical protein FHS29_004091 [Saccharothrix tamanrassetensis]|uniref:Uncharacterized protein n=1 Tax=Saccharothrix tamanrassetensis TaxID=1051531 RepID=A0A841CPS7_9PSEU|nr:hypothetical protein [Saccharothrix tamanrassetensis]MBB5957496.1 hypothetical protein [Saccharothrix tamanrassetensis]